jgi:hypothetical protein
MAETDDAAALRKYWSPAYLGLYEGKWIAFTAASPLSDLPSNTQLQPLLALFQTQIDTGSGPIFAFVTFSDVFA